MDWDYTIEKDKYLITLDSGKKYFIQDKEIEKMKKDLNISILECIDVWLTDRGYLINNEQEELDKQAKGKVKIVASAEDKPKKKTPKERVQKENPTKELIIQTIAKALETLETSNISIENKAKIITFEMNGENFKVDLIQKRKNKEK